MKNIGRNFGSDFSIEIQLFSPRKLRERECIVDSYIVFNKSLKKINMLREIYLKLIEICNKK
jgi:hypothetical protein